MSLTRVEETTLRLGLATPLAFAASGGADGAGLRASALELARRELEGGARGGLVVLGVESVEEVAVSFSETSLSGGGFADMRLRVRLYEPRVGEIVPRAAFVRLPSQVDVPFAAAAEIATGAAGGAADGGAAAGTEPLALALPLQGAEGNAGAGGVPLEVVTPAAGGTAPPFPALILMPGVVGGGDGSAGAGALAAAFAAPLAPPGPLVYEVEPYGGLRAADAGDAEDAADAAEAADAGDAGDVADASASSSASAPSRRGRARRAALKGCFLRGGVPALEGALAGYRAALAGRAALQAAGGAPARRLAEAERLFMAGARGEGPDAASEGPAGSWRGPAARAGGVVTPGATAREAGSASAPRADALAEELLAGAVPRALAALPRSPEGRQLLVRSARAAPSLAVLAPADEDALAAAAPPRGRPARLRLPLASALQHALETATVWCLALTAVAVLYDDAEIAAGPYWDHLRYLADAAAAAPLPP